MFQRKRRFKRRLNGRGHQSHIHGGVSSRPRSNTFSNGQARNNFRNTLSAEKLLEKYNALAKEAMSHGDKTLSENYLQHADHFMRIIEDKNRNREHNKDNVVFKPVTEDKNLSENKNINQDVTTEEKK